MTAQIDTSTKQVAGQDRPVNGFEACLEVGWSLSPEEIAAIATEFRTVSIVSTMSITFGNKTLTPKRDEGMTDEERIEQKRAIDETNATRKRRIYDFLRRYFSAETSRLLMEKVRPYVTGIVLLHCPTDEHFTLIPEHDAYIGSS